MKPNPFLRLVYSSKVWLAVFALIQSVVFQFIPDFPKEIWISVDALVGVVIAAIAAEDFAAKWGSGSNGK
jgi:hypothetical protein